MTYPQLIYNCRVLGTSCIDNECTNAMILKTLDVKMNYRWTVKVDHTYFFGFMES